MTREYYDSIEFYNSINHEAKAEPKTKAKKDYDNYASLIFGLTVIVIVIAVTIYTFIEIAYGQPVEFKTYTNNDMNFTIQHPSNWKVETGRGLYIDSVNAVEFQVPDRDREIGFGNAFAVRTRNVTSYLDTDTMTLKNTTLEQYAQEYIDGIQNDPTIPYDIKILRQNQVTLGGNNGIKVEYTSNENNEDHYGFNIITIANEKFYVLSYEDNKPLEVPETLPLINKMVESFQVGIK